MPVKKSRGQGIAALFCEVKRSSYPPLRQRVVNGCDAKFHVVFGLQKKQDFKTIGTSQGIERHAFAITNLFSLFRSHYKP
jgi:hypothetical protein